MVLMFAPVVLLVLVALLFLLVAGLINRTTRPFVIGLAAFLGLGVVFLFLGLFSVRHVRVQEQEHSLAPFRQERAQRQQARITAQNQEQAQARRRQEQRRIAQDVPPPKSSAPETKPPKTTLLAALRQAAVQAWTGRGLPPPAEAPGPACKDRPIRNAAETRCPIGSTAPAKMEDNCYTITVHAGPYTTPLECERELPKALQGAVAEYCEISLGPDAAAVHLPEDALRQLVHGRWTEVRPMEIGGSSQDMHTLHALVVFDALCAATDQPRGSATKGGGSTLDDLSAGEGCGPVFGGVIGLLALTWCGLRWAGRPQPAAANGPQAEAPRVFPGFVPVVFWRLRSLWSLRVLRSSPSSRLFNAACRVPFGCGGYLRAPVASATLPMLS